MENTCQHIYWGILLPRLHSIIKPSQHGLHARFCQWSSGACVVETKRDMGFVDDLLKFEPFGYLSVNEVGRMLQVLDALAHPVIEQKQVWSTRLHRYTAACQQMSLVVLIVLPTSRLSGSTIKLPLLVPPYARRTIRHVHFLVLCRQIYLIPCVSKPTRSPRP